MKHAVLVADTNTGLTHVDASVAVTLAATKRWLVTVSAPVPDEATEAEHLASLLDRAPGVTLLTQPPSPQPVDAVFVRLRSVTAPFAQDWKKNAVRFIGITDSVFPRGLRAILTQLGRLGRQAARCDVVLTEARSLTWNPYRGLTHVVRYEPNIHPDFWLLPELSQRMAQPPPAPSVQRRYRLMFAGAGSPSARKAALDAVKPIIDTLKEDCFWRVYRDATNGDAPLSQSEYVEVMEACDFALCPPGWCPWTHRLVEAVSRLTVPIADSAECAAAGLIDGETALFVRDGDWPGAVRQALSISPERLAEMRTALLRNARVTTDPKESGERLCRLLGLA